MQFDIITIFPKVLDSYYNESIIGRAQKNKLIKINYTNLRDFTTDQHRSVDDSPYGGGPGMILKIEPIARALKSIRRKKKSKIVLLDPKGKLYNHKKALEFSKLDQIIFVNGYYEGIDSRVDELVDEKISMGEFVLSNSELATAMIIDSASRLIKGVLGNEESLSVESYSDNFVEYPQYTRPEQIKIEKNIYKVPEILLSGNHKEIETWRREKRK
ncbi:MAG: tRNA (guanosine(37)-N1)-methyltransferase TrmD [Patescibacteria group bacterium]|nr:tRNA (guanosine(37)-N1)-methyltransferase TrmD [Patescibacteria group bacterium]MDD4304147.1 tRNA (guanosine(37)-N1)-methyltransferase TrmD [Patescibacteria group bacterium]MDD4695178.1 tRNA (guanosine(37)-N1)-methyltransferase TrmD [Patescibacteria group bacterium]